MGVLDDEVRWCREQLAIMKRNGICQFEDWFKPIEKPKMNKEEYNRLLNTSEQLRNEAVQKRTEAKNLLTQAESLMDAYDKFRVELVKMKPADA